MSWQRSGSRLLDAIVSLCTFALVLVSRPVSPQAVRPAAVGTRVAVLAAEEASFGVWQGRDLAAGGALALGARLSVALAPSERSEVQLFVRKGRGPVKEVRLVARGSRRQAPAPGQSLVFVGGRGALLLRVCPEGSSRLDPSGVSGQQVLQAALAAPTLRGLPPPLRLGEGLSGPGWETRLPDGAPVALRWRWVSGRGCQWARVPLGEGSSEPVATGDRPDRSGGGA